LSWNIAIFWIIFKRERSIDKTVYKQLLVKEELSMIFKNTIYVEIG
jgi:hypothetical protein